MILHWLNPQIWDHEYKGAEDTEEPQYRGPTQAMCRFSTVQKIRASNSHAVQGSTVITLEAPPVLNKVTFSSTGS